MLKMILKDLRLSPLRSILTSVSMLVGIIAMLGSVLVGTLGREYLIFVNAQVYGWSPTYSFVITESDFHDRNKMEQLFQRFEAIDDVGFRACFVFFHYKKLNCISNLYCRLNFPQKYEKELIYNCKIN